MTSLIRIDPEFPVDPAEVQSAVSMALSELLPADGSIPLARLEGADALQLEHRAGQLHVLRLAARCPSGLRVDFRDVWLPLPVEFDSHSPVVLEVVRAEEPIRAGAGVYHQAATLRLAHNDNAPADIDGSLMIGVVAAGLFHECLVSADRLDSSRPWREIMDLLRGQLAESQQLLEWSMLRFGATHMPQMLWCMLLQPVVGRLDQAIDCLKAHASPELVRERLEGYLEAISTLPRRAADAQADVHIIELLRHIDFQAAALRGGERDPADVVGNWQRLSESVSASLAALGRLAQAMGQTRSQQLPPLIYRGGQLYRRTQDHVTVSPSPSGRRNLHVVAAGRDSSAAAIAVLWTAQRRIAFGEVRLVGAAGSRAIFSEVEPGEAQVATVNGTANVVLDAPSDLSTSAVAFYERMN